MNDIDCKLLRTNSLPIYASSNNLDAIKLNEKTLSADSLTVDVDTVKPKKRTSLQHPSDRHYRLSTTSLDNRTSTFPKHKIDKNTYDELIRMSRNCPRTRSIISSTYECKK
jgi:hypothetical protein